jgi:anti-anti-sigma factor
MRPEGKTMKLTLRQLDTISVVALEGELTIMTAVDCLRQARRALASTLIPLVAIDLSRVQRIDASGCAALIALRRDVQGRRGNLCLFGLAAGVRLLLEVMQVHLILDIAPDLAGAISALDGQADVSATSDAAWRWSRFHRSEPTERQATG